jgi:hypothetical protein
VAPPRVRDRIFKNMSKLQFDPTKETRLQATLRVIREAENLEDFKKKRKCGDTLIKEFRETVTNVSGKMMKNKWDTEYLQQLDFQIHLIQKTIDEKADAINKGI